MADPCRAVVSAALILVAVAGPACVADDPCTGGWMTFFFDHREAQPAPMVGEVCDPGGACRHVVGFWSPCPDRPTFCGSAGAWTCLDPGAHTYRLFPAFDPQTVAEEGAFILPEAKGGDCKVRVHVNTRASRIEFVECGGGAFVPTDATRFDLGVPDAGGGSAGQ